MGEIPPLRVREADGSPNLIPVFELIISGGTLSRVGAIGAQLLIDSGASGAPTGAEYITYAPNATLSAERVLIAGTGMTVASDGTNFFTSVNTNVRDKTAGFFAGGNLSTTHIAEQSRVYIPFNMELRDVRLAVATTPVGANIIVNVGQFGTPISAMSAFFTDALRPIISTGGSVGSAGTISNNVLFVGSFLGFSIDQVGTTTVGSDLTVTVIARSS